MQLNQVCQNMGNVPCYDEITHITFATSDGTRNATLNVNPLSCTCPDQRHKLDRLNGDISRAMEYQILVCLFVCLFVSFFVFLCLI